MTRGDPIQACPLHGLITEGPWHPAMALWDVYQPKTHQMATAARITTMIRFAAVWISIGQCWDEPTLGD